jgi:F-type H+-transporting ATPase subunit epsilon
MLRLELVTLNGAKVAEDVYEVTIPTLSGYIGVLPGHMPLVSVASNGVISVRRKPTDSDDMMEHYATHGGVVEVNNNVLSILVDGADHAEEINEAEAQKTFAAAQKLKAEAKDQVSLEHAQSLVDRQAVRLQVAGLKRRSHRR